MSSQPPSPLSERELEIMTLVATGASNREIAHSVGISPNTVKVHLRNIFEKVGAASRTEATLIAVREGWVTVEGMAPSADLDALERPEPEVEPPVAEEPASPVADASFVEGVEEPAAPRFPPWAMALGALLALALMLLAVSSLRAPGPGAAPTAEITAPQRWAALASLPEPRTAPLALAVGRDLFLLGGDDAEGPALELWRLREEGEWEALAPLPEARRGAGVAAVGGSLFVAGGTDGAGAPQATLWRYDVAGDAWEEMDDALPEPLSGAALAAFEGELYLFGGASAAGTEATILRLGDEGWEEVGALPEARRGAAATTLPEGIIVAGGVDGAGRPTETVYRFDPRAAEPLEALPALPTVAAAPRLVALGGALYLLEGTRLYEREPTGEWRQIEAPEGGLPPGAALLARDPYLLVAGGGDTTAPRSEVLRYEALYRSFLPIVPGR